MIQLRYRFQLHSGAIATATATQPRRFLRHSARKTRYAAAALLLALGAGCATNQTAGEANKNIGTAISVFSTGISMTEHTGKMAWLDANTLAITTYGTYQHDKELSRDGDYRKGKIVAFDVETKTVSTIMEYGFLNCTNPHEGVVTILKEQYFSEATPDPKKVFYTWDAASKTLKNEKKEPKTPWSWSLCTHTLAEDMKLPAYGIASKRIRYLQPGDGALGWSSGDKSVMLWKPNKPLPEPLDATTEDVDANGTPYFSFNESYLLVGGRFRIGGAKINYRGEEVDQTPAVTMTRSGAISRTYIPKSVKAYLDDLKPNPLNRPPGNTIPTAVGPLVYVDEEQEKGGGLYLESQGKASRIWCTSDQAIKDCIIEQMQLAPDGCALAFTFKEERDAVHVLRLCQNK